MVAALPAEEREKIITVKGAKSIPLQYSWKRITGKPFNSNPVGYLDTLVKAQREGTLKVVEEIIKEQQIK